MRARVAAVAAAAAVWGCGKSATAPTPGQTTSCTVTLGGAIAGTFDCRPAVIGWTSATNTTAFGFSVTATATAPDVVVSVSWSGRPAVRAYASSDSAAQGVAEVLAAPGVEWLASRGGAGAPQGSYTLTLTSVSDTVATSRGEAYLVAGTLTATLPAPPTSSASGSITLTATF